MLIADRFGEVLGGRMRKARRSWRVFDAIGAIENPEYIVDASKNPLRLRLLHLLRPESIRQIHLVRDGRVRT